MDGRATSNMARPSMLRGAFRRLTPAVLRPPCVLAAWHQDGTIGFAQALKKNEDAAFSA